MSIYDLWLMAKENERAAVEERRILEDQLTKDLMISETQEGSNSYDIDGFRVKVTCRMNRSIDSEILQEVAAEEGLSEHLPDLFRWKPEINMKAWKAADASITGPLLQAVTTKPGRPSYSIESIQE